MKKLTITAVALLSVAGAAFASSGDGSTKERATIVETKGDTYKVFYTNKEESTVKIKVKNEEGKLLRVDKIKANNGFMKPYNLEKLEAGTYYIELTDQYGVVTEKITIEG